MRDFEYVLSLARGFAPSEEAAHLRDREEPAAATELPRPSNVHAIAAPRATETSGLAPAEHVPLPAAGSRR